MNLLDTKNILKKDALRKLREGDTSVLKGLPPVVAMQVGMELQNEVGRHEEPSPYSSEEVGKAMVEFTKDSGIREAIIKRIEEENK